MVEQQKQRVEQEMTKVINELDRDYLRKMQAVMHRCAAKCCDDNTSSLERVQHCIERCSVPLSNAQNYVQKELENLQQRLQRCVMDCNDEIRDKMGPSPTDTEVQKFSALFENCAVKCVDKHVDLIPNLLKAMKGVLSKQLNAE